MAPRSFLLDDTQTAYLLDHSDGPDELQDRLMAETRALGPNAQMQIGPDQGTLLTLLTRATAATSALEVGTFTGYSSLCIARGLAPGGRLLCCDVSEEWTAIARRYWAEAGVDDRIELRLAPALETLRALRTTPAFDFVFLDADKPSYPDYWEEIVPRVRPRGLVVVDNVLRGGAAWDPDDQEEGTKLIRSFNDRVASDGRVQSVMLAVADGITVACRRGEGGRES